jgi:hypothetical protein
MRRSILFTKRSIYYESMICYSTQHVKKFFVLLHNVLRHAPQELFGYEYSASANLPLFCRIIHVDRMP